jgi:hypothetical protein
MRGLTVERKRLVALVLAFGLVVAVALAAATQGLGRPGVPEGDVALVDSVDDGTVSDEAYQRGLEQSAARLGLEQPPAPDDPQFQQVNDETMQGLLLAIWAEGEAEERGIEVTETDVQAELDQIKDGFESKRELARVVRQSKFCTEEELDAGTDPLECEDVVEQGRLLALQRKLADAFSVTPEVSSADIEDYYEANQEAFAQPASRNVRVILNEDEAKVEKAREQLDGLSPEDEDFKKAWRSAAKQYSQDQASKDRGGLLEALVEGQGDPELDSQVFSAEVGELVGPFETDRGFYLIQVEEATEATTQSLEEATPAIEQQLTAARQQAEEAEVQNDFIEKWTQRTSCIEKVEMQFCRGYVPPDPEPIAGQPEAPQPAAVNSISPIEPGTGSFSGDGTSQTGPPVRPRGIGDECASPDEVEAAGEGAGVIDPCGSDDEQPESAPAGGVPPGGAIPVGPGGAAAP